MRAMLTKASTNLSQNIPSFFHVTSNRSILVQVTVKY